MLQHLFAVLACACWLYALTYLRDFRRLHRRLLADKMTYTTWDVLLRLLLAIADANLKVMLPMTSVFPCISEYSACARLRSCCRAQ